MKPKPPSKAASWMVVELQGAFMFLKNMSLLRLLKAAAESYFGKKLR